MSPTRSPPSASPGSGARDRVARIIRSSFGAEADRLTGRVVAEGSSVHVRTGDVVDGPEPDPAAGEDEAEAVAPLGQLAERFVQAAAAGDEPPSGPPSAPLTGCCTTSRPRAPGRRRRASRRASTPRG
ncbi:hypothetical protein [Micromonospora echinaurantiaca]|uniref:hypothetical protein n=1 Tax=Micromonospora echinaurantiaca TaxID=47857 RepID=UPI0037BD1DE8